MGVGPIMSKHRQLREIGCRRHPRRRKAYSRYESDNASNPHEWHTLSAKNSPSEGARLATCELRFLGAVPTIKEIRIERTFPEWYPETASHLAFELTTSHRSRRLSYESETADELAAAAQKKAC